MAFALFSNESSCVYLAASLRSLSLIFIYPVAHSHTQKTHTLDSLLKRAKANNAQGKKKTEQQRRKEKIKEKRRLGNQKKRRRNQEEPRLTEEKRRNPRRQHRKGGK